MQTVEFPTLLMYLVLVSSFVHQDSYDNLVYAMSSIVLLRCFYFDSLRTNIRTRI